MDQEYLKQVITPSSEYLEWKSIYRLYTDLYVGGAQFKAKSGEYLFRRHREPGEVFQERVDRAFYENYIGSIVDWYSSTLFRREPIITLDESSRQSSRFYSDFLQNCDRNQTGISDFFRKRFCQALIYGCAYIGLEFPRAHNQFRSRLEEEAAGADKAYLIGYDALDVIRKVPDEDGTLASITIRIGKSERDNPKADQKIERFLVYDKKHFYLLETGETTENSIRVVDTGRHSCSEQGIVPIFQLEISQGMWLMNKAAHLQLEHFNKSNSLAWSLGMALYATPVIYSKKDWSKMLGESYYIHLDPDDKFGWTEPEGNVYRIAIENLNRLQEEIYRTCYLMNQSKSWLNGSSSASASSKKRDYQITQEVLRAYGDNVKDCMKKVLSAAICARKDNVTFSVTGLDEFEVGEFGQELEDAKTLLGLGIESKTFKQQLFKKLAFKLLSDINETAKERIANEIDYSFMTPEERN